MRKLSVKNIVEFRRKSERSKRHFANDLKVEKKKEKSDDGGDYWVSCMSAINHSFRIDDPQPIIDRKDELKEKYDIVDDLRVKARHKRNKEILDHYERFDFKKWKPSRKIDVLKKQKHGFSLSIKGLEVQVNPQTIFSFEKDGKKEVGAIWFVARTKGLKREDVGMFADVLYRCVKAYYPKVGPVSSRYCIAVDVIDKVEVNYSQIEKGTVSPILNATLDEIKKLT